MKLAWLMILAERRAEEDEGEAPDGTLASVDQLAEARARRKQ